MSGEQDHDSQEVIHHVANIVAAYVSHNTMRSAEMPEFIAAVHGSLQHLIVAGGTPSEPESSSAPAVAIKRSVHKDFIVCLEDGKKFKSLRRHLSLCHHLTPDEYRAKWGLASDYPMVAPTYSATRSQLAKESGLGQVARAAPESTTPVSESEDAADAEPPTKKPRGRPRKLVA